MARYRPLFCLFSFFSHSNMKYSINVNYVNLKSVDVMPGIRTWGHMMVGADGCTELLMAATPNCYLVCFKEKLFCLMQKKLCLEQEFEPLELYLLLLPCCTYLILLYSCTYLLLLPGSTFLYYLGSCTSFYYPVVPTSLYKQLYIPSTTTQ